MKYTILVSHGKFAAGLKDALSMLAGERNDLLAHGLENGKTADAFAKEFAEVIAPVSPDDEILLYGDLIGGSPLTTACNVLCEKGLNKNLRVIGGMNLPGVLSSLLSTDFLELEDLKNTGLNEGKEALKEFVLAGDDEEDDI